MSAVDGFIVSGVLRRRSRTEPLAAGPERAMREYQARASTRYRLADAAGRFVHMEDFSRVTDAAELAWIGFMHQLRTVRKRHHHLKTMRVVPVPPDALLNRGLIGSTAARKL